MYIDKDELYYPCGIYQIKNTVNEKVYIGSSKDLYHRCNFTHGNNLEKDNHPNNHLQRSWNKYGSENFEFEVLIYCSEDDLLYYEQLFLDQIKPYKPYIGYNDAKDAKAPMRGGKLSQKHKNKLSKALSGREMTDEHCRKIGEALEGREFSDEHLKNLSKALSEREYTQEWRDNIGESVKKRHEENGHPMEGENHTKKSKRQIRKSSGGLNDYQALKVKWELKNTDKTQKEIAKSIPVGRTVVTQINNGEKYTDIKLTEEIINA